MAGIFMVKQFQQYLMPTVNEALNVWGYKSNIAVIGEVDALADAWIAQVLPKVIAVQADNTYTIGIEVLELNGTNFTTRALSSGNRGLRSGGFDAPFIAWSFRLNRASLGKRSGAKRFGCLVDSDVVNGAAIAGVSTALADLATQIAAPLTVGIIQTWFPVILERPVPPSTTWGEHASNGATYRGVSTQNTRKTI